MATIQGVYVALFGRPADPNGLTFFNGVTKNGADLSGIGDLAATQEYKDRFNGQSNVQIINSIYQSLFNRDAEPAGLNFFVDALNKGTLNVKNIAIAILDGAQGADKTIVTNKLTAADAYTKAIDTPVEIGAYTGNNAAAQGRAFLATVNANASSIPNAAAVDAALLTLTSVATGGVTLSANDITLTTAVSPTATEAKFKTTSGDDTVNVATATADTTTVGTIDGGFGTDTVVLKTKDTGNATAGGTGNAAGGAVAAPGNNDTAASTLTITPEYTNVEKLVVTAVGSNGAAGGNGGPGSGGGVGLAGGAGGNGGSGAITIDVTKATAVNSVVNDSSTAGAAGANGSTGATVGGVAGGAGGNGGTGGSAAVQFDNLKLGTTLGLKGTITDTTTFNFKAADVTGSSDAATLSLQGAVVSTGKAVTIGAIETLNVAVNGTSTVDSLVATAVKTITVTGSGDLTIGGNAATDVRAITKFDASALNGKLTLDLNLGATNLTADAAVTINGTKNADIIKLETGSVTKDTIVYAKDEASNVTNAEVISGFTKADDKIDLKAFALTKTALTSFTNVIEGASFGATSSVGIGTFNTKDYVFIDTNNDGKLNLATDFAVEVTGAVAANLTTANFVFA